MPSSTSSSSSFSSSSSGSSNRSRSAGVRAAPMKDLCNAQRYMHQAAPPAPRASAPDYGMLSLAYHDHKKHHHLLSPPPHHHHHHHHSRPPPSPHLHHHGSLRISPSAKPLKKVRKLHLKLLKRLCRKGHPRPRPWSACRLQKYGDLYDPTVAALGMFYAGEAHEIHDHSPGCCRSYQERMGVRDCCGTQSGTLLGHMDGCARNSAPPPPPHGILSGMGQGHHDRHGYRRLHPPPPSGPRHHPGKHGRRSPSPPHSPGKKDKRRRHGRCTDVLSPPPAARHNEEGAATGKGACIRSEIVVPPRVDNGAGHEPPQLVRDVEPGSME